MTPGPKRYEPPRIPDDAFVSILSLVRGREVELEVGGGRGGFALERLEAAPEHALLGFEIKKKWAFLVDEKLGKLGLWERARVFGQDANQVLPRLGPEGALARAFLHFPDPWWKKRHEKRLVLGDPFLRELGRLLRPGGELFVQTDVEERADQYRQFVADFGAPFVPAGDAVGSPDLAENPYGARSPREHRALADGLPIWRLRWRRGGGANE